MTEKRKEAEQQKPAMPREKKVSGATEESSQDACRCKEVARKTPRELLRVMLDDLTFWKKR